MQIVGGAERRAQRTAWRALVACRSAWASYLAAKLLHMITPDYAEEEARGVSPETAARLAPFEPFLCALLFKGAGLEGIRPLLPGIARALRIEGDLSDAQILDAARDYAHALYAEIHEHTRALLSA